MSVQDLAMMTRQLATLLKANVPLVDSLGAVSDQVENEILSDVIAEIKNNVNEGSPFTNPCVAIPKSSIQFIFPCVKREKCRGLWM